MPDDKKTLPANLLEGEIRGLEAIQADDRGGDRHMTPIERARVDATIHALNYALDRDTDNPITQMGPTEAYRKFNDNPQDFRHKTGHCFDNEKI